MLRRLTLALTVLLVVVIGAAAAILFRAHLAIRREIAALPSFDAIQAAGERGANDDLPQRVSVINTASQAMPRGAVLDPGRDPAPAEPYTMSHPAFVLEWRDGRMLLIDVGMTRDGAAAFGKPLEWVGGAAPMVPHGSAAEVLGEAAKRVKGIVFTHLHTDHVGGIGELCQRAEGVRVPMTEAQATRTNHTTSPGLALLQDAPCVRMEQVDGGPLIPLPGFPGVFLIAAGGHTPGSQLVLAFVAAGDGTRRYAFTGDIVNHRDGIAHDVPKPALYRWLVVPEAEERQTELRRFLKRLHDERGFALFVSHDAATLRDLPSWGNGNARHP